MGRENPEDEFALILQGARALPHCPAAWVGAPCLQCHGPELGRGPGGRRLGPGHFAVLSRGCPGMSPGRRPSTQAAAGEEAGSGRSKGCRETFRWLSSSCCLCTEAAVPGTSKKTNLFSGDFDKITHHHWDKAHFVSDKSPLANLFSVFLNAM